MAFFKNFQENLPSVSSLLDSVSTTVSSAMDDLSSAVSDVTYTVSDQLTEQVNTIINKVQTDEADKKDEGEGSAEDVQKDKRRQQESIAHGSDLDTDGEGRKGRKLKKSSMWTMEVDEEEILREKERQEEARRAEEEEWEWCYAPSKGWYRKRRDPSQPETASQSTDNQKGISDQTSKEEPAAQERHASSHDRCKNEGNNHNENTNGMHLSNSQELQESQEMPDSFNTSKELANCEENGKNNNVEEDDSSESPEKSIKGTGERQNGNEKESKLKKKVYSDEELNTQEKNSRCDLKKKDKDKGCPEEGFSESEGETPKNHEDSQEQRSGSETKDSNKDYSSDVSTEKVKRKKGSSSHSNSADGSGGEFSECTEDPEDTESCLNKGCEDAPSDSTVVLGPEVKTSSRRFPRCVLL